VGGRAAVRAVLRILVLLAVAGGLLLVFEKHLIYFPTRAHEVTPAGLGLASEEVELRAEDGVRLHGWFLPVKGSRLTVLVCHGNGGNVSHRLDRVLLMQSRLNVDTLLFDYRGYGKSEGSPDEQGTYRDARAAYRWLVAHGHGPERVVLFGESLGSAVALQLALEVEARALVLESPFASVPEMARAVYPFLPLWRWHRLRQRRQGRPAPHAAARDARRAGRGRAVRPGPARVRRGARAQAVLCDSGSEPQRHVRGRRRSLLASTSRFPRGAAPSGGEAMTAWRSLILAILAAPAAAQLPQGNYDEAKVRPIRCPTRCASRTGGP
jgi:pimeloyl-ACP methyl ester carboxylesterase